MQRQGQICFRVLCEMGLNWEGSTSLQGLDANCPEFPLLNQILQEFDLPVHKFSLDLKVRACCDWFHLQPMRM